MTILTGGAGFVGSNLLKRLNAEGVDDVLVVDNLKNADKYRNLVGARFADYIDRYEFRQMLENGRVPRKIDAILHQGACTDTMEYDGAYMMRTNYNDSKALFHLAMERAVPFVYASSASVYGHAASSVEEPQNEWPLNVYGYSKLEFDRYVRGHLPKAQSPVVGLRYFNVYGPGEAHKGRMASMVHHFFRQVEETGEAKLFGAFAGYGPGESTRDFVYVRDLIDINLHFLNHGGQGIVNAGSGEERTWNDLAHAVIAAMGKGRIAYMDFPEGLKGKYQLGTKADLTNLRAAGYNEAFTSLEDGVRDYLQAVRTEFAPFRPAYSSPSSTTPESR